MPSRTAHIRDKDNILGSAEPDLTSRCNGGRELHFV